MTSPAESDPKPRVRPNRKRAWKLGFDTSKEARASRAWDPNKVGVIPSYPKTEAVWLERQAAARLRAQARHAEGVFNRTGVPDGWAGRKHEVAEIRTVAREEATIIVKHMIDKEIVTPEDPRAEEALTVAVEIARDKTMQPASRLQAARIVLDFTRQKPATKADVTVRKAEDFLMGLAAEALTIEHNPEE